MPFWIGTPEAIAQLPAPLRGLTPTAERPSSTRSTIGGGRVVSRPPAPGRRTYQLQWAWMDPDDFSVLEEFFTGARGPGPYALLDPTRRNHLSANQSAASTVDRDASGFSVAGGEHVSSTSDTWLRGPRALRWTLPSVVTSGVLELDPPAGLVGVPTPTVQPWTFSGQVLSSVAVTPVLSWRRADGSEVSTTSGAPVSGPWTAFTVSASAPPAGAVAVRAQLRIAPGVAVTAAHPASVVLAGVGRRVTSTPALLSGAGRRIITAAPPRRRRTISTAGLGRAPLDDLVVVVDQLQLDMNATARSWVLGTGVPLVTMTALTEAVQMLAVRQVSTTLVEVG